MKAKINHIEPAKKFCRVQNGTNYWKGDYDTGSRLFEVKTDKGTFNLDRGELLSVIAEVGVEIGINITANILGQLVGKVFDTNIIKDK